ncbi:MAG: 30S ribosomal protein S15 [Coprobacillus sp.]|nr:30S ribosomal protein S15 [Coprobacillus sp.]
MALTKQEKSEIIAKYATSEKDTGSVEVQVALLTAQIARLTEHLKANKKDTTSKRGLYKMIGQRRALLDYLAREDREAYLKLISELGLRK